MRARNHEQLPDAELLLLYKESGSMEVLGTLFMRYSDLLYGVCLKYLKDPAASRDAVANVFEELVQKLRKHEVDNFKSWIYTVAKNHCLMDLRSRKNIKLTEIHPDIMQSAEELHLNGMMEKEAEFKKLEDCLQTLSSEQKTAVELFYLQNKCYKEIEAETGLEWNKVRSYIQNGRRNLKICMEKKTEQIQME
jgi:RNA polymerase sigma factor (sigma-70 family)